MAERSLRGMSIGAKSLESDDNVDFAARHAAAARSRIVRILKKLNLMNLRNLSVPIGICFWSAAVLKSFRICWISVLLCIMKAGYRITSRRINRPQLII